MTSAVKHILAAMVFVLLFSLGMSKQHCLGPCAQYPDCDGTCKKASYQIGQCVHAFPNNDFCCCAKFIVKPSIQQFN